MGDVEQDQGTRSPECEAALGRLFGAIVPAAPAALAATLIKEFGSMAATLAAAPERLARICGPEVAGLIRAVRQAHLHSARVELLANPVLPSTGATLNYLHVRLAHLRAEQVMALFLDARHRLIIDDIVSQGSLNAVGLDCREIAARALELGASAVILAHNHPSGDPSPSEGDIRATRILAEALRPFEITLIDHLVIGRSGCASFRAMGLL